MKKTVSIFNDKVLREVPIFYRYFTESDTENVRELRVYSRFSKSEKHFTSSYLNYALHKPLSDLEIIAKNYEG